MKLAPLFSKYLYQHKQLRLPGLGVFSLDPAVIIPDPADKLFADFLQNIRFNQQQVNAPDEDFINFIRTETGKIKPLAESDLDSFLSDGIILLNIGKPFQIEGVGSLQKTREGILEFKPGEPHLHKQEVPQEADDQMPKSKSFYLDTGSSTNSRKIAIALGAIAGIIAIIWGGYKLYNRNGSNTTADTVTTLQSDTMAINTMPDSLNPAPVDTVKARSTYNYVIERTPNKARALRRYGQLISNQTNIKLQTQDSIIFNLYFELPSTPADTARIRDSLKLWYGRRVVYVE